MMNKDFESLLHVTPLSRNEAQQLTGGFVCIKPSSRNVEDVTNTNCGGAAAQPHQGSISTGTEVKNGNCGCQYC